jgi:outer membrane protein TolC
VAAAASGGGMHNLFEAGFDAKWELDIFGQVAKELEAADASIDAAREALRNTQVVLTSEVAREYLEVRSAQRRLAVAKENIATPGRQFVDSKSRFDAGLTSELDVKQAEAQLASTQATVPSLESAVTSGILRLAILTRQQAARNSSPS